MVSGFFAQCQFFLFHQVPITAGWRQHGMRSLATHNQQCETNLRPFEFESNALATLSHAPN